MLIFATLWLVNDKTFCCYTKLCLLFWEIICNSELNLSQPNAARVRASLILRQMRICLTAFSGVLAGAFNLKQLLVLSTKKRNVAQQT